jgi:antitoxin ParD1/3/4
VPIIGRVGRRCQKVAIFVIRGRLVRGVEVVFVNVSLTPELEELIQERVRSGRYTSASEVVREALRLLQDRDELRRLRMDELRAKVAAGLDSLDRGEGVDGDAVIDEILSDEPRAG